MNATPHCHVESFLSASTLPHFLDRAKELGREYFVCADHGYLYSSLKAYNAAKKAKLKPILGLEFYFKDPGCPLVSATAANRCRYFTATIYAEDQEAYQAIVKLVSRTDLLTTEIYEEKQSLLSWADLEYLARFKTNLVLGGIHCMVGKVYLSADAKTAAAVFDRLNNLFNGRLRVAMICEPWRRKFAKIVEIKYVDGSHDGILASDVVATNKARRIKASDLLDRYGHTHVLSKVVGGIYTEIGKEISSVRAHTGFLPLPCDVTLEINKFLKALANRYRIPVLASDYAYYANKTDHVVQHVVLEGKNKIQSSQHMKSAAEILEYLTTTMGLTEPEAQQIIGGNDDWCRLFDGFELKYEWRLASMEGQDALRKAMEIIRRNGRMRWDDPIYVDRLKMELNVIAKNGIKDLTPYFLPIVEVLDHYKEQGHLTSVGRGSAGGSLFCFLLGIVNIDPIEHQLPFSRFFSLTRIRMRKLPDIDTDLPQKTTLTGDDGHGGFLYQRWGNRVGHISTRQTVRLRSAIKDADRYLNGVVSKDTERFTASLPQAPQGMSDQHFIFGYENDDGEHEPGLIETSENLQNFIKANPEIWDIVAKAMGITRAFGRHACAMVLSDVPLDQVIPVKDGYITHYEHKDVESAGLVKMDFLTISQLLDIEVCLRLINKKDGSSLGPDSFLHHGAKTYIWKLPADEEVYKSTWGGETATLFQINTKGMSKLVTEILPSRLEGLSACLALERPGPKDYHDPVTGRNMVEEYVMRRKGESEPDIKELAEILPDSYGTLIYQEDLGKVAKQLAGFSDEDAELLRENMAKKKMVELTKIRPLFLEGAKKRVSPEVAEKIWEQMVTFGRYGFSVIHSKEYSMITYACMFLKHHYPLEWLSAVLTNAEPKEIMEVLWPHVKDLVAPPDINLSTDEMVPDYANNKIRSKLGVIRGLGEKTIEPLVANRPYRDIQDFVDKDVAGPSLAHKLIHVGVLDSLFPPHTSFLEKLKMYGDAVELKAYRKKVEDAKAKGKTVKALGPRPSELPEAYLNLRPMQEAAMKKSILPSMYVDLFELGCRHSKILAPFAASGLVVSPSGHETRLVSGPRLQRLDDMPGEAIADNVYVACTCFILESKEFPYAKGTKKALKMVLDCGNFTKEFVKWPNYDSGILEYPQDLAKHKIATVFFKKRPNKKDLAVTSIVVET